MRGGIVLSVRTNAGAGAGRTGLIGGRRRMVVRYAVRIHSMGRKRMGAVHHGTTRICRRRSRPTA